MERPEENRLFYLISYPNKHGELLYLPLSALSCPSPLIAPLALLNLPLWTFLVLRPIRMPELLERWDEDIGVGYS